MTNLCKEVENIAANQKITKSFENLLEPQEQVMDTNISYKITDYLEE